jgi:hypothetical protein
MARRKVTTAHESLADIDALTPSEVLEADYGRSLTYFGARGIETVVLVSKENQKLLVQLSDGTTQYVNPRKCEFV